MLWNYHGHLMYLYSAPISSGLDVFSIAVPYRENKYIQGSGLPQRFTVLLKCIFCHFCRKRITKKWEKSYSYQCLLLYIMRPTHIKIILFMQNTRFKYNNIFRNQALNHACLVDLFVWDTETQKWGSGLEQ